MTDILESAGDWLARKMKVHASRPVTYRRGQSSVSLQATIGRTEFEITGEFGVVEKAESRDFLIQAADLSLDGVATQPKRGDQIHETQGNTTFIYEVMAPGKEPHWRYSDQYRKVLRVHTKQIDTQVN